MYQQQQQVQSQGLRQQTVEDQKLRYMIQQDFLNVIGIANDLQEVIDYFGVESNHIMINIYMNKLICQTNLSNMIHVDQADISRTNGKIGDLQQHKQQMQTFLQYIIDNKNFDPRIQRQLMRYNDNSLCNNPCIKQQELTKLKLKSTFNEKTAERVIQGIQKSDQQFDRIQKGEQIRPLNQQELDSYLNQRSIAAQQKLDRNWKDKKNDPTFESQTDDGQCCIIF